MKDIVEIHEFFVQGSNRDGSHVLLHISEPSLDEEDKGYFFALCEIINGTAITISHIQKMIDDVEASYYENDEQKKNAFEASIEYINRRSHHILQNNESTLNLLFGVIEQNKIAFASRGPIAAHLLYHKGLDLHHVNVNEEKKTPNDQIFGSLVEGEIRVNDFFVITTDPVDQYFSLDRIEKILTQKDTRMSAMHIQKTLEQVKSGHSLAGILIHRPTEENIPRLGKLPRIARPIQSSLPIAKSFLASTMSNISKRLNTNSAPTGIFNPQPKPLLETDPGRYKTQKPIPRPVVFLANTISIIAVAFLQFFQAVFRSLVKLFEFLFVIVTNRRGERQKYLHNFYIGFHENTNKIKRLPLISKILLALSVVAVLIFSGSILWIKHTDKVIALQQQYDTQIDLIRSEKDTADRSLLYGDTGTALTALQHAQSILETIKNHPNKNETEFQQLSTQIENDFKQLRKQSDVATTLKSDIGAQFATAQIDKMVRLDNTLVVFGSTDHSYYFVNLDTGVAVQKNHDTIPSLLNASSPKEYDKVVFTTDASHIAQYDKTTDALSTQDIAFPSSNVNISSLLIYNRRLYTLDSANNQIYKHNQTQIGYDKGTPWITDAGVDIKDVVSFTIDGELYALKNTGEIIKFSAGKIQPFSIAGLDPALKSPTQIWTYNDVKNIYVLDPATKRVIALDKNGTLVKQYTSSEWNNPTAMIVDEPGKKIYILDSNKIYSFPL